LFLPIHFDGDRAGVLGQERPLDLVAEVGEPVTVDVGDRGRLDRHLSADP